MDVRRPSAVPARPDRQETGDAGIVRRLRPAQEGLAGGAPRPLPFEAGVFALGVAMPDIDPRAGDRPAVGIDDLKQVLADLTVASDDPTTWFDLRTALGG